MKRAISAAIATAAGVAWIATFKVAPHQAVASAPDPTPAGSAEQSPSPSPGQPTPAQPTPSSSPSPSAVVNGTFTGSVIQTYYGDVQVKAVVLGGKLVDVKALTLPSDRSRSAEISQIAGPMLRTEAIQAQSAYINIISGATYTTQGYAESLNAALIQAHLGQR